MTDETVLIPAVDSVVQLRRVLHRYPELSGAEVNTASEIIRFFSHLKPSSIIENLGGQGVAIVFAGRQEGPTVLLRCELDALPIQESIKTDYCSERVGVSHKCGHDGHMAILAAVGLELAKKRLERGRVVLLYQPAEENGKGARAVVEAPGFDEIRPHFAFALHNLPGFPLGHLAVRSGVSNCASRGMAASLFGKTAHAAHPENGLSPARAMVDLIQNVSSMPPEILPNDEYGGATLIGARLGKKAFGTTPGKAEVWATLRSETDGSMDNMVRFFENLVSNLASQHELEYAVDYEDVFNAVVNSPLAVNIVQRAAGSRVVEVPESPFRWSEDFGQFTALCEGALVGIGAGESVADLHDPAYDFPDELIPLASSLLLRVVGNCLAIEMQ